MSHVPRFTEARQEGNHQPWMSHVAETAGPSHQGPVCFPALHPGCPGPARRGQTLLRQRSTATPQPSVGELPAAHTLLPQGLGLGPGHIRQGLPCTKLEAARWRLADLGLNFSPEPCLLE